MPAPRSCCQTWKLSRVFLSNERKISSSSTVGATCVVARVPFSGILGTPFVAEVDLLDLADVDARDPYIRLLGELSRLGEVGVEAVAVRLERDGAAECGPQVQQQPEARQREDRHHEEPADCRDLFLHALARRHFPQIDVLLGKFVRLISVPSCASSLATFSSAP